MSHPGIEFNSDKILLSQNQRGKNVTRQSISQLSYSKLLKFQFSISNLPSDIHFSSAESIVECIGFYFFSNIWFCHQYILIQTSHHSWTSNCPNYVAWPKNHPYFIAGPKDHPYVITWTIGPRILLTLIVKKEFFSFGDWCRRYQSTSKQSLSQHLQANL